jgi:hypothetical protein
MLTFFWNADLIFVQWLTETAIYWESQMIPFWIAKIQFIFILMTPVGTDWKFIIIYSKTPKNNRVLEPQIRCPHLTYKGQKRKTTGSQFLYIVFRGPIAYYFLGFFNRKWLYGIHFGGSRDLLLLLNCRDTKRDIPFF